MPEEQSNDDPIKLKCPVCGEQKFERIYTTGFYWLKELPLARVTKSLKLSKLPFYREIHTYRCLACDYILSFAK